MPTPRAIELREHVGPIADGANAVLRAAKNDCMAAVISNEGGSGTGIFSQSYQRTMPRYTFHLLDYDEAPRPGDGLQFDGPEQALEQAVQGLVEIAGDELPATGMQKSLTMIVRGENGVELYRVAIAFEVTKLIDNLPGRNHQP